MRTAAATSVSRPLWSRSSRAACGTGTGTRTPTSDSTTGKAPPGCRYSTPARTPTPPTSGPVMSAWSGAIAVTTSRTRATMTWASLRRYRSDHYEEVSLANWLSHLPPKLVSALLRALSVPQRCARSRPCRPSRRCVSVIRGEASDSLREGGQIEACQVLHDVSPDAGQGVRVGLFQAA